MQNIHRIRCQVSTARRDGVRVIIAQPDSSIVGAADASTHARTAADVAHAVESVQVVDSLHDGYGLAFSAFVAGDVADDVPLGQWLVYWILRGEGISDLVPFLEVPGTEAAVVVDGAEDVVEGDFEDLTHDFLEVVSLRATTDLWL